MTIDRCACIICGMPSQARRMADLIGRVYDTVVDPTIWGGILSDLVDLTSGNGACHMAADVDSGAGEVIVARQTDPNVIDSFHGHYSAINPLVIVPDTDAYGRNWHASMMCDEDWMDRRELERSEYFNDFLKPMDAHFGLYLRLNYVGQVVTTLSISRGHRGAQFGRREMKALESFHRHALRATHLSVRFRALRRFADGAAAALDAASDAMLLLDAGGRLVHANSAAERMLAKSDLIGTSAGRLTAMGRSGADFEKAIAAATASGTCSGNSLPLVAAGGRRSGIASVLPVGSDAGIDAAAGPAILVRVARPTEAEQIETRMLRFGLTNAERSIVRALLGGASLAVAAAARGVSVNTARRQIASVFDKTGTHRQAELVGFLTRDD